MGYSKIKQAEVYELKLAELCLLRCVDHCHGAATTARSRRQQRRRGFALDAALAGGIGGFIEERSAVVRLNS